MAGLTNKDPSCYWCGFTGLCFHPGRAKQDGTCKWCDGKCEHYIKLKYGTDTKAER